MSMLQFLNVSKKYKTSSQIITALDEVSFEIADGEFVFLVGHSGSGKTSILRHIIREELPSSGKIFFNEQDITRLKRSGVYKLRREIGTIFQDYKLIEEKNVYENVSFAMEVAGMPNKEIKETVPYVLDIVNLSERMRSFPPELSGGEKQRVAIARAIVNNPKILIADEPTGNLDPDSAWDVVQVLAKINKWGTTVIMATHGTEIVNSMQKRVIELEKGKMIRDDRKGTYEEVDEYSLKVLMKHENEDDTEDKSNKKDTDEGESEASAEKNKKTDTENKTVITLTAPKKEKQDDNSSEDVEDEENEEVEKEDKNVEKLDEEKKEKDEKEKEDKKTSKLKIKSKDKSTPKEVENVTDEEEKAIEEIIHKADTTGLEALKLNKKLQDKLKENGYHDVEDILTKGVAEVNKNLSNNEIRQLARAIKRFVTTE